nr:MAG TPA: hypothetical protein [Caudoviricetes sp.]
MKELLNKKAKMLVLMLAYIDRDNPMYHNILIRIDEINRILKEIEDNENNDEEFERKRDKSILENMMDFLNGRKVDFNTAINLNEDDEDWVNDYKDYIAGKMDMCDEAISQLERLMK